MATTTEIFTGSDKIWVQRKDHAIAEALKKIQIMIETSATSKNLVGEFCPQRNKINFNSRDRVLKILRTSTTEIFTQPDRKKNVNGNALKKSK